MSHRVSWCANQTARASRAALAVVLVGVVLQLLPTRLARAQACCVGGSALIPGRLALHESLLGGAQLGVKRVTGTFDSNGRFRPPSTGSSQWEFDQDVFATIRWLERGQLGVLLPVRESLRDAANADPEFDGGIGDLRTTLRWDFVHAAESPRWPGFAVLAQAAFPTGVAPEQATLPLGSDATGTGAVALDAGAALERDVGPWLFNLLGQVGRRLPRKISGLRSAPGLRWQGVGAVGYAWSHRVTSALIAAWRGEGDTRVDGDLIADSGLRQLNLALAGTYEPNNSVRFRVSVFVDPPLDGASQNWIANAGATGTVILPIR